MVEKQLDSVKTVPVRCARTRGSNFIPVLDNTSLGINCKKMIHVKKVLSIRVMVNQ